MKIIGNGNKTNYIKIKHKGAGVVSTQIIKQDYYSIYGNKEINDLVQFEFDDLREVDMMIDILVNFRNGCANVMGNCHKVSLPEPLDKMFKG